MSQVVPSDHAVRLTASTAQRYVLYNQGGTLYYADAQTVSSTSNDGSVLDAGTLSFSAPIWVRSASQSLITLRERRSVASEPRTGGFATWEAPTATSGTDTAFASGTVFVASLFLPVSKTITGISYLLGSVGGTTKIVVQLNDAAGNLLANSTLTSGGTTAGTAANIQAIDFTAPVDVAGPATYYVGVAGNGATAKLRTVPAHTQAGLNANSLTQTVSVPAAIAPPVTFTADTGPIAFVY